MRSVDDPEAQLREDVAALELALTRLGVTIREEALPEASRGGLVRLGDRSICFVPLHGGPGPRREALLDALRRVDTGDVFLTPRVRGLLGADEDW